MDVDALQTKLKKAEAAALRQKEIRRLLESQVESQQKVLESLHKKLTEMGAKQVELENMLKAAALDTSETKKNEHTKARSERRKKKSPGSSLSGKDKSGSKPRNNQANLPVFEDETSKSGTLCDVCQQPFQGLNTFEERELVHVQERAFELRRIKREKCKCGCGISTSPLPQNMPKVLPRARYSAAFMVMVAASRFVQHLPYERQAKAMRREGLTIQRQQLYEGVYGLYRLLNPLLTDRLRQAVLSYPVVGADETGWPMLEKGRKLWQILALQTPRASYFVINPTKEAKCTVEALTVVKGDNICVYQGALLTDGASNFSSVTKTLKLDHPQCWAHARRKFFEAREDYPQANALLDLIDELYAVEAEARDAEGDLFANRRRLRKARSRPAMRRIRTWLTKHSKEGWSGSALRGAINYVHKRWKHLRLFLANPAIPVDNNATESAIRGPVLGRKNYYGSKSRLGTQINAFFYSIVATCDKNGLNPAEYLMSAVSSALAGEVPDLPIAGHIGQPLLKPAPTSFVQTKLL